jgi:hypothetical protein
MFSSLFEWLGASCFSFKLRGFKLASPHWEVVQKKTSLSRPFSARREWGPRQLGGIRPIAIRSSCHRFLLSATAEVRVDLQKAPRVDGGRHIRDDRGRHTIVRDNRSAGRTSTSSRGPPPLGRESDDDDGGGDDDCRSTALRKTMEAAGSSPLFLRISRGAEPRHY